MKIVENALIPMLIRIANEKSWSTSPPKRYSAPTGSRVMIVVASDRRTVSQSEVLMIVLIGDRRMTGKFSRTRSKMMIVS